MIKASKISSLQDRTRETQERVMQEFFNSRRSGHATELRNHEVHVIGLRRFREIIKFM
jgi:hypothetical protein